VITLDTSGVLALLNGRDPDHRAARTAMEASRPLYLVPAGILAEVGYMVERRLGAVVVDAFLEDLVSGALSYQGGREDLPRIRELVDKYFGPAARTRRRSRGRLRGTARRRGAHA
jgi:predicted nucleic acid-binding protein